MDIDRDQITKWTAIVTSALTAAGVGLSLWDDAPDWVSGAAPWAALVSGIIALYAVGQLLRHAGWFSWLRNIPWNTWRWYWFTSEKTRGKYWLVHGKHARREGGELVHYTPGDIVELTDHDFRSMSHRLIPYDENYDTQQGQELVNAVREEILLQAKATFGGEDKRRNDLELGFLNNFSLVRADALVKTYDFPEAYRRLHNIMEIEVDAKIRAARLNEPPRV